MGLLSIPHLIIIFIVALVAFGPEKLPELARNLGKVMADLRRASNDLRGNFEEHLRELERESRELERRRADTAPVAAPPASAFDSKTVPESQDAAPSPLADTVPASAAATDAGSRAENAPDADTKPV